MFEIVLAFIQPFMALVRPLPNAPNRYIFNWAHMLVGYSAHILASKLSVQLVKLQVMFIVFYI